MKKTAIILFGILFTLCLNINAQVQEKVSQAEKAIKNKDYAKALTISKDVLETDAGEALKLLIQLREKDVNNKNLFEYIGDAYSKMSVAELAASNYADAEKIDSLDVSLKFKSAETFYKLGRYKESVNKYLKITSLDPKNAKAFYQAASILFQSQPPKPYADVATLLEKYLALESSKDAYEKITASYLGMNPKNYEKAYSYSLDGLKLYPDNIKLKKNAAIASFGLKKYDEAAKFYYSVPDSQMTVPDMKNAGTAFQQIKADSIAIRYFEMVVKKDSTQSGLFMSMASTYFTNKNYELAVKFYDAKIKSDSTFEPAYRYKGFALLSWEKYNEAKDAFKKALKLVDTTYAVNYWLAQTYIKVDSTEQAAEQFTRVLKIAEGKEQYKKDMINIYEFLGNRAYNKKNYQAAINYYQKAVQLKPTEWRYMEVLGACYFVLQNNDEAIRWYKNTLKYNPNSENAKKGLRRLSAD
jgi:tetratricopeptide (TPR) repeat protein